MAPSNTGFHDRLKRRLQYGQCRKFGCKWSSYNVYCNAQYGLGKSLHINMDRLNWISCTHGRSYLAAPKKTLNLANVTANNNRRKSPIRTTTTKFSETRKQRKKREWLARKSDRAHNDDGTTKRRVQIVDEEQSYWAYLPDLVLEIIFQMLPYKVTFWNWS